MLNEKIISDGGGIWNTNDDQLWRKISAHSNELNFPIRLQWNIFHAFVVAVFMKNKHFFGSWHGIFGFILNRKEGETERAWEEETEIIVALKSSLQKYSRN